MTRLLRYYDTANSLTRLARDGQLRLLVHVPDWAELKDGERVILTVEHGGPARTPERFAGQEHPRLVRSMITDRRRQGG